MRASAPSAETDGAQAQRFYFLSASAGMTVPPFEAHFFSDISIQPFPLQPFCPLQELSAPLQAPLPLQAFTPWQWTLPASFADASSGAAVVKSPATAAAIITPLAPLMVMRSPRWSVRAVRADRRMIPNDLPCQRCVSAVLRLPSGWVTARPRGRQIRLSRPSRRGAKRDLQAPLGNRLRLFFVVAAGQIVH